MLYEPLPGSAAVILVQLGIIEEGQVEALGQRTYDAECGRLSLALDDGRTVELERAMHLQSEDGYAVRIRSRAGQTISRSFIHIDRNLAVRNLHNDRMVYIDDAEYEAAPDFSVLETLEADAMEHAPAEEFPAATSIYQAEEHQDEDLHAAPSEQEVLLRGAAQAETEQEVVSAQADAEPEALLTQPEPESFPPQAESDTEALHTGQESEAESLHAPAAIEPEPEATAPHAEPALVEYPEIAQATAVSDESGPAEALVPAAPEPFVEAEHHLEATPEPLTETAVEAAPVEDLSAGTPQPLTAPETHSEPVAETASLETAESAPEEFAATEATEELSPIPDAEPEAPALQASAEPEASVLIDEPESQDTVDLIAEAPKAIAVEASEPEALKPVEAIAEPSPEELPAVEASPEPESEAIDPRYLPLHESLASADAAFFDFIAQTGTVHTFEHRETYRYIHIDAASGLFYDQTRTPISRAAAIKHAFTPRVALAAPTTPPSAELESEPVPTLQASPATPVTPAISEPELRTRSHSLANGHARAAVKLDADTTTPPPDAGLSLDAFTRKRAQLERDSWRNRIAEISRALRRNRTPTDDN
jgi:hypothetical protein